MSELAVAAHGLEKRFGPVPALRALDLELPRGRTLAVLGPNGAGKSTLLRLLAGLARPTRGALRVGPAAGDRRARRARVGLVAHATFLYAALTARENLLLAARLYGVAAPGERADALLAEQGLAEVADRRAGTFSRGMAQRLSIARGLVHDPPVLLLDEPFAGLDPRAADRLEARLARASEAGRTAVLVTHDLARAASLADEGLVLVRGRGRAVPSEALRDAAALEAFYREAVAALEGAAPAAGHAA